MNWLYKTNCSIKNSYPKYYLQSITLRYFNGDIKRMSSHEVSTALRPFYFAVHPDLFWLQPHAREVNENSLKQLNSYLEALLKNTVPSPASVTFYLRNTNISNEKHTPEVSNFKSVKFNLQSGDLHATVQKILKECELSTDYIDGIKQPKSEYRNTNKLFERNQPEFKNPRWSEEKIRDVTDNIRDRLRKVEEVDLSKWLNENVDKARSRLSACHPVQQEIERLSDELVKALDLKEIVWDCGWGLSHFRGCLQSFYGLAQQYPLEVSILQGRTLIFGNQTGVSLDGHIILSSSHVRHCWLELLQSVPLYDIFLTQLPEAEKALSDVLLGIQIDHRKFQPTVMVQKYNHQLGKLASALYKYRWQYGYPDTWPRRLSNYQLVVECEAGPLMLSPTGQFIVPAGCPAFLLVNFISDNMREADEKIQRYNREKYREQVFSDEAIYHLEIESLQKDNNVTPDLMISCLERLIENKKYWKPILKGSRIRITNFYSVLQDGEICIPWNWKVKK